MGRNSFAVVVSLGILAGPARSQVAAGGLADLRLPFYVYHGFRSPDNHFAPSGWMGDYGDIQFDDHYRDSKTKGATVIRVRYSAKAVQGNGWAGIYWQNPPNNWG